MVFFSTLDESEPLGDDLRTKHPPYHLQPFQSILLLSSFFILPPPPLCFLPLQPFHPSLKVCPVHLSFCQSHNFSSAHLFSFSVISYVFVICRPWTLAAPLAADPVQAVVVVSVQRAAVCRRGVEVSAEQPVDHAHQDLFVLLPQEGVGKGVRRCFAVAQALTDDSPVAVHIHGGQELGQPAGGAVISKEGGLLNGDVRLRLRIKNRCDGTGQVYQVCMYRNVDFHIYVHASPFSRF